MWGILFGVWLTLAGMWLMTGEEDLKVMLPLAVLMVAIGYLMKKVTDKGETK